MNTQNRIQSIASCHSLDSGVTGFEAFHLQELELPDDVEFVIPENLRLGQMVERMVGMLIRKAQNFEVLFENVQLIEDKTTVGELDFIFREKDSSQLIHMELAYKFYLYDPSISENQIENWIGPNRKDSLVEKLVKLRKKQFPLLYSSIARETLEGIDVSQIKQQLCLLPSLFVPHSFHTPPVYAPFVKGVYMNLAEFKLTDSDSKRYYIPSKKEWGMDPALHEEWLTYAEIEHIVVPSLKEVRAPMVWQKDGNECAQLFVVWW